MISGATHRASHRLLTSSANYCIPVSINALICPALVFSIETRIQVASVGRQTIVRDFQITVGLVIRVGIEKSFHQRKRQWFSQMMPHKIYDGECRPFSLSSSFYGHTHSPLNASQTEKYAESDHELRSGHSGFNQETVHFDPDCQICFY